VKKATDEKPSTRKDMERNAIEEALGDLEARLEAYLVEWRRRLNLQGWPEAGIVRKERRPVATEQGEQRR
jgi:hypothetical protein